MDDNFHCPKCRTDLRHTLTSRGDEFARCPNCASTLSPPFSQLPTQASTASAITNAPRAEQPSGPVTYEPHRGKRLIPEDDDYRPPRKRIIFINKHQLRTAALGVLVGMASGLSLGIIIGGICTANSIKASPGDNISTVVLGSIIVGTGLMIAGAVIGGLIGIIEGEQA